MGFSGEYVHVIYFLIGEAHTSKDLFAALLCQIQPACVTTPRVSSNNQIK